MLSSTDPDVGDTFTYSLVTGAGGIDNGAFAISGDELRANAVFDFETKSIYLIRVRTTDRSGLWFEKEFTITVIKALPLPFVVTGLTATNVGGVRPTLQWGAATNATSYSVYLLNTGTGAFTNLRYTVDTTFIPSVDLPAGSYRFLVKSVNAVGNGGGSAHGERILKCRYANDLREVVEVPSGDSSCHCDAVFVFLLFEQAQAEAFQPREIIGRVAIADA
jgi:hypothetical protein